MFTVDQNITAAGLREKNLVKVFFSMNNHEVATPEMMLEEARSYVMFYGEADGKVSAYIGLHLLQTGRRLFYAHSSNPFSPGETGSVEDEALCFVEGLGALVDEVDIAKLSAEEKGLWIDGQDIFSLDIRLEKPPEAPSPQPAEAVKAESQETQPSPAAPAEAPQAQVPAVQPEPQQAPQMQPAQAAPQLPQAVAATPQAPPPPAEESTPEPSAPQPDVEAERGHDAQAVPSPAEAPETRAAPKSQPTSKATDPREAAVPAPERTRPRSAARTAAGPGTAFSAAFSTDKQDSRRKTREDDIGKPPKPPVKKGAENNAGVVRRDREALARLLSSF